MVYLWTVMPWAICSPWQSMMLMTGLKRWIFFGQCGTINRNVVVVSGRPVRYGRRALLFVYDYWWQAFAGWRHPCLDEGGGGMKLCIGGAAFAFIKIFGRNFSTAILTPSLFRHPHRENRMQCGAGGPVVYVLAFSV